MLRVYPRRLPVLGALLLKGTQHRGSPPRCHHGGVTCKARLQKDRLTPHLLRALILRCLQSEQHNKKGRGSWKVTNESVERQSQSLLTVGHF